eukprot:CAMPEP_0181083790 /NCGR_PEP_ID=MMETSP1071-20121207/4353_1 /TAXON_ID=35127 /ORGANISM="Thalassiosira sp., Strain NH16" /LENGTH=56 /DNA_ID=CAMNT_0023165487 /DNA_START=1241 /DNA_END=1411 /DNA_ORIENTATION=-
MAESTGSLTAISDNDKSGSSSSSRGALAALPPAMRVQMVQVQQQTAQPQQAIFVCT